MRYGDEELKFIVGRIEKMTYELTDWELGFFNTVKHNVNAGNPLSPKQAEVLSKIWDRLDEA